MNASVPAPSRARFYLALGTVTAATLMLQIIETRIISVTSWYHLAFFIISIAMFGLTAGAVYVYLRRERYTAENLNFHLTGATLACALSTIVALFAQLTLVSGLPASFMSFIAWAEFAVMLSLPFFFSGIVVSLALTRSPFPIAQVYGADLIGAAIGCLAILFILNLVSSPAAIIFVAALLGGAALLFAAPGDTAQVGGVNGALYRRRGLISAALLILAAGNLMLPQGVRATFIKGVVEPANRFAYEKWNSFTRITVDIADQTPPALWGPSPLTPDQKIDQRWMTIDGAAGTAMYRFSGDFKELDFLKYDVSTLAYNLPGLKKSAVIGVGGGRDVASAKFFGIEDVTGVEINPILVNLLTERFKDFTALGVQKGVHFEVDEARSWFARTEQRFDLIQMSLIDTWAATGAGAFTLSENGLYTVEAWNIFLKRLTPNGFYTVSRWHAAGEVNETGRMISLAVASLQKLGAAEPRNHIYLATAGHVATLVLSRGGFTPEQIAALDATVARLQFTTLLAPGKASASPVLDAIVASKDAAALDKATDGYYLDLSPTTDSRPFFFNQLRMSHLFSGDIFSKLDQDGVMAGNLLATITLVMLVAISLLLVVLTIVAPMASALKSSGRRLAVAGTLYFALIGAGFMMAEIGLMQRLSVFLGHPVYALSVVLFSLILSTGLGSLVCERVPLNTRGRLVIWAVLTAGYLFTLPLWMPALLGELESSSLLVRASFCVAVLAPAGLLMGFGFPTGMALASAIDARPTPWFWGINGAMGVLAASIAVLTSIAFGIDVTLRAGALCYLALPLAGGMLVRGR